MIYLKVIQMIESKDLKTILLIHSSSDLYGSDKSLLRTIDALSENGYSCNVILPYRGPLVDELKKRNISVNIFNIPVLRREIFNFLGIIKLIFNTILSFIKISNICRTKKIKIIHSNTSAVLIGGFVSKIWGLTHIWHVREIIVEPKMVRKFISFMLFHFSTIVIGVSSSVIENLKIDQPRISDKAIVLHNGLEPERFDNVDAKFREELDIAEDKILVAMIARVSHWKGQNLFTEVASKVLPYYENVVFLAVGSPFRGQEFRMEEFKENVSKLKDHDRFIIHEFVENVEKIFEAINIFVLPSTSPDPFPTTVLEAMASKLPIVSNNFGGVVEMLANGEVGGYLVEPNSAEAMAERIKLLIDDKNLRIQKGNESYNRFINCYSVDIYKKNILKLYKEFEA